MGTSFGWKYFVCGFSPHKSLSRCATVPSECETYEVARSAERIGPPLSSGPEDLSMIAERLRWTVNHRMNDTLSLFCRVVRIARMNHTCIEWTAISCRYCMVCKQTCFNHSCAYLFVVCAFNDVSVNCCHCFHSHVASTNQIKFIWSTKYERKNRWKTENQK